MEITTLSKVISEVGFPIGIALLSIVFVWYLLKLNRQDTDKQISRLDKNIDELKVENREDKKMFQSAIDSFNKTSENFNESVREFRTVNSEISKMNNKMEGMSKGIIEIKAKVN